MLNIQKRTWDKLDKLIHNSKSILLSTHINADGDGLGSEIAFYYYLKSLNKECRIINSSPLPYNFMIIDPESAVEAINIAMSEWLNNIDLTILFDIGDHRRIGDLNKYVYDKCHVISIDHHPAKENHPYDLNIVDSNAPATGYLIWKYFQYRNLYSSKMPINIANALYASIVTDTYPQPFFNEQHLLIYDFKEGLNKIAQIHSSFNIRGEYKCDLHPRYNDDYSRVAVDFCSQDGRKIAVFTI